MLIVHASARHQSKHKVATRRAENEINHFVGGLAKQWYSIHRDQLVALKHLPCHIRRALRART